MSSEVAKTSVPDEKKVENEKPTELNGENEDQTNTQSDPAKKKKRKRTRKRQEQK